MISGGIRLQIGMIMNNRFLLLILFVFISFLRPLPALSDQIILDSEKQFQFAQHYMERGEYQRAIGELERLIYFFPKDEKVPEAYYFIGWCHLKAKEYESARKILFTVTKNYSNKDIAGKALFLIGETYYIQGVSAEAENYFKRVITEYPQTELKNAALYRLGWSQMQSEKWQEASKTFTGVEKESRLYVSALNLSEKSLAGEELPLKEPIAAGIMAGIVPGLGHAYCNRYKDGTVAFLLNGVFILAAIESFDQDHDVLGGILTFLELGWYSGNIYSAVNCAHKHNRKVRNDFRRRLPDNLNLDLFGTREGHLGLALKFQF